MAEWSRGFCHVASKERKASDLTSTGTYLDPSMREGTYVKRTDVLWHQVIFRAKAIKFCAWGENS